VYEFAYHRADSVADAVAAFEDAEDGTYIAGGMTLVPLLKQRLAAPSTVIDIGGIAELTALAVEDDHLVVGALVPHDTVARSTVVRDTIPALAALAGAIGDPQVRNRGTLGGSVANNDPAADYPAGVLALGATIHTDRREIAAEAFFTGLFETALELGELVTRVSFPIPAKSGYARFRQAASGYPLVGVFVAATAGGPRVAVTGAGPGVFTVPAMERALAADFSPRALDGIDVPSDGLNADLHGSAEYRAHLVSVMARRAVAAATGQPHPGTAC